MSKVVEIINNKKALTKGLSFKVNEQTYSLLHKVFLYRKKQNLSHDFSHFLRQCLQVSLMCDKPLISVPQFDLPDIDSLIDEIQSISEVNQQQENEK